VHHCHAAPRDRLPGTRHHRPGRRRPWRLNDCCRTLPRSQVNIDPLFDQRDRQRQLHARLLEPAAWNAGIAPSIGHSTRPSPPSRGSRWTEEQGLRTGVTAALLSASPPAWARTWPALPAALPAVANGASVGLTSPSAHDQRIVVAMQPFSLLHDTCMGERLAGRFSLGGSAAFVRCANLAGSFCRSRRSSPPIRPERPACGAGVCPRPTRPFLALLGPWPTWWFNLAPHSGRPWRRPSAAIILLASKDPVLTS